MEPISENVIELSHLSTGYAGRRVTSDATASVGRGQLVSLLGANGAGKSTLLKTILGELAPIAGSVKLLGRNPAAIRRRDMARSVSVVNTDRVQAEGLTVDDLVGMGRYPHTGFFGRLSRSDRQIVREALEAVGMGAYASRSVSSLSDGERQKVLIARALAQATPLVILDEPTAFLDVASRVEINCLLGELAHSHGKTILMTSHDVPAALEMSDVVWLLNSTGGLTSATPAALLEAHASGDPASPLDLLFAHRAVRFDAERLDYRAR